MISFLVRNLAVSMLALYPAFRPAITVAVWVVACSLVRVAGFARLYRIQKLLGSDLFGLSVDQKD
jgi:hypothetical protein